MSVQSLNDNLARIGAKYTRQDIIWGRIGTATSTLFSSVPALQAQRCGDIRALPNPLPTGVAGYIPERVDLCSSSVTLSLLVAKKINLGSIDISGASGTFTDANAMPTETELGTSIQKSSPILCEVTTALNATPGSLAINYTDADGNARTGAAQALQTSAVAQSCGFYVLNSPDTGVRDITGASRSGGTTPSGVIKLWGVIPVAFIPVMAAAGPWSESLLGTAFNLVRCGIGDSIGVFVLNSTATKVVLGSMLTVGE